VWMRRVCEEVGGEKVYLLWRSWWQQPRAFHYARVSVSLWFDFCLFAVDSKVIAYLSDEELSHSCHCERSACPERSVGKAISWPIWGLLRRLRRLAM